MSVVCSQTAFNIQISCSHMNIQLEKMTARRPSYRRERGLSVGTKFILWLLTSLWPNLNHWSPSHHPTTALVFAKEKELNTKLSVYFAVLQILKPVSLYKQQAVCVYVQEACWCSWHPQALSPLEMMVVIDSNPCFFFFSSCSSSHFTSDFFFFILAWLPLLLASSVQSL